ncbi:DivIVA domain-containing protein [Streptococcus sp. E29BA]|uniref:DivIVA domain-containing protein n=1 Tax=Streptococcus sp. E29BA TaxID=3278716 RepID=UPI00359E3753
MTKFRRSLFGYKVRDVDKAVKFLKAELRQLKQQNDEYLRQIKHLTDELRKAKAEEELIRDAIIDAKHLSKRLVREAKEQATEMLFEAERDINKQFVQFEENMSVLKHMHANIVSQKQALKQELETTIDRYKEMVGTVDQGAERFDRLQQNMTTGLEQVAEKTTSSKQVIFLPKAIQKKEEVKVGLDVSKLSATSPDYAQYIAPEQPPKAKAPLTDYSGHAGTGDRLVAAQSSPSGFVSSDEIPVFSFK